MHTLLSHLRRFPRVRLTTQVAIAFDGQLALAYAADISEGGLGLSWPQGPPPRGQRLQVSFYLPTQSKPVTLFATVEHTQLLADGHGLFGVQFAEPTLAERHSIRRYVNLRRFIYGDLRRPSRDPATCQRMSERLHRLRM